MTHRRYSRRSRWTLLLVLGLTGLGGCWVPAPESTYVPMSDGTEIAVDVWKPQEQPADGRMPTIVRFGRYWRDYQMPTLFGTALGKYPQHVSWLNAGGYVVVMVDVRGTGASFGVSTTPWSPEEVGDYPQIVDWVTQQSWSDGTVGALGVSYEGVATDWLGALNHPAVKAVQPLYSYSDVFLDVSHPGGLLNDRFVKAWGDITAAMDRNDPDFLDVVASADPTSLVATFVDLISFILRGVRPVTGGLVDLYNAIVEHQDNPYVYAAARQIEFRDDLFGPVSVDRLSPLLGAESTARAPAIRRVVGWLDAGTARGALRSFNTLQADYHVVVIAPECHTGDYLVDPYNPATPPAIPTTTLIDNTWQAVPFLDQFLKDGGSDEQRREVIYWTYVEKVWKSTTVWPPAGFTMQRWYFAADGQLSRTAPTEATGDDTYTVNFDATTGLRSRWFSGLSGLPVYYPDRATQDGLLLVYQSPPFEQDMELTGHPVVSLQVASTEADCAFFVYLEDVDPDGYVAYLCEGEMRALQRRVSDQTPTAAAFGPYHTYQRADALPLVPGEVAEISFDLLPISTIVRQGHRLRVAVGGADKDTFTRVPTEGVPVWNVQRNAGRASYIDVPVKPHGGI